MAHRRNLVDDPNTPYDDTKILASTGGGGGRDSPNKPPTLLQDIGNRLSGQYARPVVDQARVAFGGDPRQPGDAEAAPIRRSRPPQDPQAAAAGASAGTAAAGYLRERKALAPGVRRYGSETADPSDVYVTVDRNGNRVYTDNADFAASQSRGRLTRRDLAPGTLASDADRTLNDPEGGFTYAPAPGAGLEGLRKAAAGTRGGSQHIERALGEAERSQAIADTRAGTRDIDERRKAEGSRLRRQLGLVDEGGLDPRTLIALQRLGLDERKFAADREDKGADRTAAEGRDALTGAKGVTDILKGVTAGEISPQDARDIFSTLPGEAGKRASRSLRRALLQRALTEENPLFGLGDEEIGLADISSLRRNPDGSGTYVEPDSGFFDIQRNIRLSPERLQSIEGNDPEDQRRNREDELYLRGGGIY